MFGYVRPNKSEMLVREYEQYKAVYCRLCQVLGEEYGWTARFLLSYDCTFYALLALSVSGAKITGHRGRCACNPLKHCRYLDSDGDALKKAAALTVLLTYHKVQDDIADDSFGKTLGKRLLRPLLTRKARKAEERYPFLAEAAKNCVVSQKEAEEREAGIDACAEPTAKLLAEVFGELAGENARQKAPLQQFGYFLGRWVYLMDAADDLQEDLRTGAFNPFVKKLGFEDRTELTPEERRQADEQCNAVLNRTAAQMVLPLNLVELTNFGPIIENVVYKGLPELQREILFLHVKERPRRELKNL